MIFILWPSNEKQPDGIFMERRRQNEILTNEYVRKYKSATDLCFIFQTGAQKNESGSFDGSSFKVYDLYTIQSLLFFEDVPLKGKLICFENIVKKLDRRSNFLGLEVPAIGKVRL